MDPYRIKTINRIAPEGLALFGPGYQVSPDETRPHGIVVRSSRVDTDSYPELLAVARAGAGVNNITVDKATERGICVFNTPGANANAVAELLFAMLGTQMRHIDKGIAFCRELAGLDDAAISEAVESRKSAFRGVELAGKTLGVIGLGKIGTMVANGGVQRQMAVVAFDPFPALENIHALSYEVKLARNLGAVLGQADIVTLHVPLNKKTQGLVGPEFIAHLKPGAILINFSRGPVVEDEAVMHALDAGKIEGYITDFPNKKNVSHPRVMTSPHLGASTEESEENCACLAVSELKDYLEYGTISRSVNFPTVESIPSGSCHARLIMINRDVPGMIGYASNIIGSNNINIASYMNESNGAVGYNIIDVESHVPPEVIKTIESHPDVIRTRLISCHN
ncbi:MAG: 3-phosphoglycerate dehydrogenase [Deltaproteobacteria bacterium]|jgi:D-3-phosphoglycerate dehydrogenase|nr:3-phosphoglycerate dehydrogenase [Deltaproteobacteria bacterium]